MYLLEYQAKEILRDAGVRIPPSLVAFSPKAAAEAAESIGPCVVKAQIRSGGRGKAGLIAAAEGPEAAAAAAGDMLGRIHDGDIVDRVLVESRLDIAQELYLGVVLDTDSAAPLALLSVRGGVDIEQTAALHPDDLCRVALDPLQEDLPAPAYWRQLWERAGLSGEQLHRAADAAEKVTALFYRVEALTLEINPLVVTRQGGLLAGDCKLIVDEAALFRHPELQGFVEVDEDSPEARAQKKGVTYVGLDSKGFIGVMAGGAGICMTTMDEVADAGGVPAAFIDLGGGISEHNMAAALEIMMSTPGLKGLIINVFGGINNCEIMARGVRQVWPLLRDRLTVVIKMRGHSQEEGWAILEDLGISVVKNGTTTEAVHLLMRNLVVHGE